MGAVDALIEAGVSGPTTALDSATDSFAVEGMVTLLRDGAPRPLADPYRVRELLAKDQKALAPPQAVDPVPRAQPNTT